MEVQQKQFASKRPTQLVYLELGSGNGGMVTSLSEEGFRFRAVSPVRADAQMPFAFTLDGSLRLEGLGIVEDLEDDCKSGGIRFTEISDQFRGSLGNWLQSDSSNSSPSREFTPIASVPQHTMEEIRRELRDGYPKSRPADPPSQVTPPNLAFSASSSLPLPAEEPPLATEKPPLAVEEKEPDDAARPTPHQESEPKPSIVADPGASDVQTLRRLFRAPVPPDDRECETSQREELPEQPDSVGKRVEISSAFLRPTGPGYHRPFMPVRAVLNEPAPETAVRTDQAARPYIPPLEESFEQAWERAKLTAPPDSSRLSRAAASGIITVALLVILGTLAYNFRQDIGTTFILLGRSISGQNRAASPPVLPQAQTSTPVSNSGAGQAEQKSSTPDSQEESDVKAQPLADKPASAAPNDGEAPAAGGAHGSQPGPQPGPDARDAATKSAKSLASSSNSKTSGSSAPTVGSTTPSVSPIESPTGEAEFNAAREMLHSPNRQFELRRSTDLLWSAVRKGYVPAEVTLADLYRRGDGVAKNCDQASVLLTAASKRGSADARRMLELMAEQGCE